MATETFVFLDLETTGLDASKEQVIEICAFKTDFTPTFLNTVFQTMVKLQKGKELSRFIQNLTGIMPEDLEEGMEEDDAMFELKQFIGEATVVAQHASFDLSFLHKHGIQPKRFICTRTLTKLVQPEENPSLKPTCERIGVQLENHHRAFSDVMATTDVFQYMKPLADEKNLEYRNRVVSTADRPIRFIPAHGKVIFL